MQASHLFHECQHDLNKQDQHKMPSIRLESFCSSSKSVSQAFDFQHSSRTKILARKSSGEAHNVEYSRESYMLRDYHQHNIYGRIPSPKETGGKQEHSYRMTCPPSEIICTKSLPSQNRHPQPYHSLIPPPMCDNNQEFHTYETIGHPSFRIHKFRLPTSFLSTLDSIVDGCEDHAKTLPNGWHTDLYSLTKQDIAVRSVPHLYETVRPILSYIKSATRSVYGVTSLKMDRNQPHVLKYKWEDNGLGHTGVQLHQDKCDFTINLMLSRSFEYEGGGTYFPGVRRLVRLEFGEFLIHPGNCVHGGAPITGGSRILMVVFANKKR